MSRLSRFIGIAGLTSLATGVACSDDVTPPASSHGPATSGLHIPASEVSRERLGMKGFDRIALQVSRALQERQTRRMLITAMRNPVNHHMGIDLTDCGANIAAALLAAGQRRGGAIASSVCADIRSRGEVVLYMDPEELSRWDEKVSPIVTALADPNAATPPHLMGYRTPDLLIDLGANPRIGGPILVVTRLRHPSRIGDPGRIPPPTVQRFSAPGAR